MAFFQGGIILIQKRWRHYKATLPCHVRRVDIQAYFSVHSTLQAWGSLWSKTVQGCVKDSLFSHASSYSSAAAGREGAQNIGLQGHICQHTPLIATLPETKINHLTSSLSDFPLHKKGNGISLSSRMMRSLPLKCLYKIRNAFWGKMENILERRNSRSVSLLLVVIDYTDHMGFFLYKGNQKLHKPSGWGLKQKSQIIS